MKRLKTMCCKIKKYLFIVLLLLSVRLYAHNDLKLLAEQAQQAYGNNQFHYVIELYDSILGMGYESAALYYNLGNAYFKNNQIPHAIWYYEKAKKLAPGDEQINFNLKLANTLITDNIEAIPLLFYERWWRAIYGIFTADIWAKIAIAFSFIAFIMLAIFLISRSTALKKTFFTFAMVGFFFTGLFVIFATKQYATTHKQQSGIVFSPRVTAKSSPDISSIDLFVIHEGTKVFISDKLGEWYEIRLANGNVGWIRANAVREI